MTMSIRMSLKQLQHGIVLEGYCRTECGTVPRDWTKFYLGDIYTERNEPGNENLPLLMVSIHSGVSDGEVDEEQLTKKFKRIEDKTQYKRAESGDLVFNMMRAWQGAVGTVRTRGMVSPAYIVAKPGDMVDPLFMNFYMRTDRMIKSIHRQSYGVTDFRLRLYWDSFAAIPCVLPPLPEQRKIAAILATQDKMIELKTKLLEETKRRKKALMQRLLAPMGEKRLEAASPRGEAASCRFSAEWQIVRLSDLFLPVNRKNAKNNKNILTISAQDGLVSQMEYYKHQYASADTSGYTLLKEGEFAYNKSRAGEFPYGAIKMLKKYEEGVVSPIYLCFAAKKGVCQDFWSYYFNGGMVNHGLYRIAQEGARNHGLLNIPTDEFFNLELRVPPIAVQRRIVAVLSTADREIDLMEKELKALELKKKALMQLLLTGIVRVGEAASCRLERAGNEAAGSRFSTRIAKV